MEFKDVVYGRRSVRRFKDTPVDDKILKEIVDAALWAPSGVNLQPWYYVVIRTPEKMTRLKEMMSVVLTGIDRIWKNVFLLTRKL